MRYCIFAEKFDVGLKIAVALAGSLSTSDGTVTMKNVESKKESLGKQFKPKGHIEVYRNGNTIDVTWGAGHLCELYQAQDYNPDYKNWSKIPLPFIPDKYQIKIREGYDKTGRKTGQPDNFAVKQLNVVEKCFREADELIMATDSDREGELIYSLVLRILNMNSRAYKRMLIDAQTEDRLIKAYDNLVDGSTRTGLVMAGNCRSIADWVVGANLTTATTLKFSRSLDIKLISIGRLQTAVLNFIVEREKAIINFKSEPFYQIKGMFTLSSGEQYEGITDRYEKKEECDNSFNGLTGNAVITKCEKKDVKREVPELFSTPDIYRAANEAFSFSSAKTLELLQSLYDKGYTTYPRVDTRHLEEGTEPQIDECLDMLKAHPVYSKWIKDERNYTKRFFDSSDIEGHSALCITNQYPETMTEDESKIYDLIAKSIIRMIYPHAVLEKTSVETTDNGVVFKTNGSAIKDPGWMVVADTAAKETLLPSMNENDRVSGQYEFKEGKTEPPKRYTEATLLTAMQTCSKDIDDDKLKAMLKDKNKGGIGRPSTQANIIKTVIDRYCTMNKKTIIPTENAMAMMEMFPVEDLKSPDMTAEWETKLDMVEKQQLSAKEFLDEINASTRKWVQEISDAHITKTITRDQMICPKCGNEVVYTKKGGVICKGFFDKKCDFGINEVAHKTLPKEELYNLLTKGETSKKISGLKKSDGSTFSAKIKLNSEGKTEFVFDGKKGGWKSPFGNSYSRGSTQGKLPWMS